jgi:FKBP-type peptidyl-prolyl cis-trans isomerase
MKRHLSLAFALALVTSACATHTPPETPAGPNFLARNAAQKRVMRTASGLQYFIVKRGDKRGQSPRDGDSVTFDYEGRLTSGKIFDSSFERGEPLTGKVGRFVKGFDEALKMMKPGDEWIVWIPPELGYGDRPLDEIPAGSVLRFRLALRSVTPATP